MKKEQNKCRITEFYKSYFDEFFSKQPQKVKDKILWTIELIEEIENIPKIYLGPIKKGLYEIRVKQGNNIYRIFCFFYKGKIIVLMNGFQKKTQKTPKQQIEKALRIKKEYEDEKKAKKL